MSSMHIEADDLDLGPEDHDKKILMLLHGGALSHRMYKDVIPALTRRGYKVLAPDLPGHGQSKAVGPFTFESATESLLSTISDIKRQMAEMAVTLVGVSLGGQVVLDVLQKHPELVHSAVISGVSIHPPNEQAQWEMPHMSDDASWGEIISEDVSQMGMENAAGIQQQSFSFKFQPPQALPPVLVAIGQHDTPMARRDHKELTQILQATNKGSESLVIDGAWHNHPIDIPEKFAQIIHEWVGSGKR